MLVVDELPLCPGYRDARLIDVVDGVARYGAVEMGTGRPVVLKIVDMHAPPYLREALDGEAAILAALGSHPNIITMYQRVETVDGRRGVALERCLGSAAQLFRFTPTPAPQAIAFAVKLAGALETAHRSGVLHCRVRPQNMLLSEYYEPVLANFESAVRLGDPAHSPPLLHNPNVHTAPELLLGDPATEATDVYGLAATLYELVVGHGPFRSYQNDSPATISTRVLCDDIAPLSDASVPPDLSDLVLWALAREPGARPPSPVWFAEELGRIEQLNGWRRSSFLIRQADAPSVRIDRLG
ncbi:MAG: serine/threonine protein kinase [Actinomycetota bacterium]|nr:serine/threonine protein kinase [Actinomycetota bacterium]